MKSGWSSLPKLDRSGSKQSLPFIWSGFEMGKVGEGVQSRGWIPLLITLWVNSPDFVSMSDMHNLFYFSMREKEKKISWTTGDFKVYHHLVLNTMTFMGIIIFSFGNEQPTDLRQGKSHTVCINFLPLYYSETFAFCVHCLASFLWSRFENYEGTGLILQAGSLFFSHLNCWDRETISSPEIWRDRHQQWKSQMPPPQQRLPTSSLFAAHAKDHPAQTTAPLGGHHHLAELPDLQMGTLKKRAKKPEWWKSIEEHCLMCSAWAITRSSSSDVLQQMNEPHSILFCLTESWYCLGSAGAKADFSTPFLGNRGCDYMNSVGTGSLIASVPTSHTPTWSPIFTGFLRAALESCDNPGD